MQFSDFRIKLLTLRNYMVKLYYTYRELRFLYGKQKAIPRAATRGMAQQLPTQPRKIATTQIIQGFSKIIKWSVGLPKNNNYLGGTTT